MSHGSPLYSETDQNSLSPYSQPWREESLRVIDRDTQTLVNARKSANYNPETSPPPFKNHLDLLGRLSGLLTDPASRRKDFMEVGVALRDLNTQISQRASFVALGALRQIDAAALPIDRNRGSLNSLAALKRSVKPGDRLHVLSSQNDQSGRMAGEVRRVAEVTGKGIVFENLEDPSSKGSTMEWPAASELSFPEDGVFRMDLDWGRRDGERRVNVMVYAFTGNED